MIVKEAQERWLPVPEWEKYYEVSNTGKVRSLDRMICRKDGSKYFKKGRILIHHPCGSRAKFGDGYLFVGLIANGIKSVVSAVDRDGVYSVPFGNDELDRLIIKRRMAYLERDHALIAARHIFGLKGGEL